MGLCILRGYRGSGKNTFLTRLAKITEFFNTYANFHIININSKFFFLHSYDIFNLKKNSLIIIDEAYKWLDCRLSQTRIAIFLSHISMESRKTNQDWYIACQYDDYIDFRFTEDADLVIDCQNIKLGKYIKEDKKRLKYINVGDDKNEYIYKFQWKNKKIKNKIFKLSCEQSEMLYKHFDTNECIQEFGIAKYKLGILQDNPILLDKEIKKVVRKINKYVPPKYTRAELMSLLMEMGYHESYTKYIYPYLKRFRNPNWHQIKKKK